MIKKLLKVWMMVMLILLVSVKPMDTFAEQKVDGEYVIQEAAYTLTYIIHLETKSVGITGYEGTAEGELVIPEMIEGYPVTSIEASAFSGCSGFVGNLNLPKSLISIERSAFYGCSGLVGNLNFPEGLISIGNHAFMGCSGLTGNLNFPKNLTSIGDYAFVRCIGFEGSLNFPENLTSIGHGVFEYCSGFNGNLNFSENLTSIGNYAFIGCSGLTGNLNLPKGLTSIGCGAFSGCSGLVGSLNLPEGLTNIEAYVFYGCSGFDGNLNLPKDLTSIEEYAFYACSGLVGNLNFPERLTSIGSCAFRGCSGFDGNLNLPEGLTTIEGSAFRGCRGFDGGLNFPESLTNIEEGAFSGCSELSGNLNLPKKLTSIGSYAFENCSELSGNLNLPESLISIGRGAFSGCSGLSGSLNLPKNLTSIEEGTFSGCSGFDGSLNLPEGLTSIGSYAFSGCSGLSESLYFPKNLVSIGYSAFSECKGLEKIIFKGNCPDFDTKAFVDFVATAYYPINNSTWTEEKLQDYGGKITWISLKSGFYIIGNKSAIRIVDSVTGEKIPDIRVKIAGKFYKANKNGIIQTDVSGVYNISVYIDDANIYEVKKALTNGKCITITVPIADEKFKITSAKIECGNDEVDLINNAVYFTSKNLESISDDEKTTFKLRIKTSGSPKKFQLIQNGKIVKENTNGVFEIQGQISQDDTQKTTYYIDGLKAGYKVYIKAYDENRETYTQCLGMKISEEDSSFELKTHKFKLSMGKKLEFTVSNEIPLLGGTEMKMGFVDQLPVKVSVDDSGLVKIAVNAKEFDSGDTAAWKQVKEDYENLAKRAQKLSSSAYTFGGTPETFGAGMFSVKANVTGYGEGYISDLANGKLKINVGFIVTASAEKTFTRYYFIYFVPVYVNFGGGVELNTQGKLNLVYDEAGFGINGGNLEVEPGIYVKLKGGVGVEDTLDVNASGKLKISYLMRFIDDYQCAKLGGNAVVTVNAFVFEKKLAEIDKTWVLYDSNEKKTVMSTQMTDSDKSYRDVSDAQLISTDYLQKRTEKASLLRSGISSSESREILDYAFQNASPKLVKTEDSIYLFYLDGVEGREAQNQTALFYQKSVDQGKSWSKAVRVDGFANETADYDYDVAVSGNDVYVVWCDSGKVYGNEITSIDSQEGIAKIAKDMDLMMSHIDGSDGTITTKILGTAFADLQPCIMVDTAKEVHIAWFSNDVSSEHGMFSIENQFKILYASSKDDYKLKELSLSSGNYPLSMDLGMLNDKVYIAVNFDVDKNLATQEDREIYLWNPQEDSGLQEFTSNDLIDAAPVFASVENQESLMWYQNGNIVYTVDGTEIKEVFTEGSTTDIGQEFTVLEGNEGKASIVWTTTSMEKERGVELFCADYDGNSWSGAYKLCDLESEFTAKPSGYLQDEGYQITYLGRAYEGDTIHSAIYMLEPEKRIDTAIGYSMEISGTEGSVYPITLEVENTGNIKITELEIISDDGKISEKISGLSIEAGATEKIIFTGISLPENMTEIYQCNLTVKAVDETEIEDNVVPVSVGHSDLSIDASLDYSNGCNLASLSIKNEGILTSDVVLTVYCDENLETKVYEMEIDELNGGEIGALVLNADRLSNGSETLYFVVSDKAGMEIYTEDNEALLYVGKGWYKEKVTYEQCDVIRISGGNRYETAYKVADYLKTSLEIEKFDTVIIATGKNYADALSGSYLASVKKAPILLTNGKAENVAELHTYIKENVKSGATIYILGGTGAVPETVEGINGYKIVRLAGSTRYETNLSILEEAGYEGQDDLLVATGKSFADSLSASAVARPILLVKPDTYLTDAQKTIAANFMNIYVIGGTGAVSELVSEELSAYGIVTRLSGTSRYETSVKVAETFFDDVTTAVVASGTNFPDGLCGGPLATALDAPLLLTKKGAETTTADYVTENSITSGYVLGGTGALSDKTVSEIFGL